MTGQELREIRQALGWTQARLADHLGVSSNHLAQLERGERTITEQTARYASVLHLVYRLAVAMGVVEPPSTLR